MWSRAGQATRAQIETAIAEADKILASPGYSSRIRNMKRTESELMRARLTDGDLQPGDQVVLSVLGETGLSNTFAVGPGSILSLPGFADIPLRGILRSELQQYLTAEIGKFLKSPTVRAQSTVRVSVLGGVGKPGYYQASSELLATDVIMAAGGPAGGIDPANTVIQRAGVAIMTRDAFRQAVAEGKTIDQLNLRAGDEIVVGGQRGGQSRGVLSVMLPILSGVVSLAFLANRLRII